MDRRLKHLFQLEKVVEDRYLAMDDGGREELAGLFSRYQDRAVEVRGQFDQVFLRTMEEEGVYPCLRCQDGDANCCRNCRGVVGYYSAIDILKARHAREDWREMLAAAWGERGFLTDKGCALPQELRSYNCTRQICSRYRDEPGEMLGRIKENIAALGDIYSRIEDITGDSDFSAF